jgi:hypothetical protein
MAGSSMKKMRKAGVTDPVTGELIPFPRMPRVAALPPGWRHFSTAAKIEHLIGLDRALAILSWEPDKLDPLRRSYQGQVLRFMLSCRNVPLRGGRGNGALRRIRVVRRLARKACFAGLHIIDCCPTRAGPGAARRAVARRLGGFRADRRQVGTVVAGARSLRQKTDCLRTLAPLRRGFFCADSPGLAFSV